MRPAHGRRRVDGAPHSASARTDLQIVEVVGNLLRNVLVQCQLAVGLGQAGRSDYHADILKMGQEFLELARMAPKAGRLHVIL